MTNNNMLVYTHTTKRENSVQSFTSFFYLEPFTLLSVSHCIYCRLCSLPLFISLSLSISLRKQVVSTKVEAERDGVKVPTTLAEYCIQTKVPSHDSSSDLLYDDLYDDDIEEEDDDDDDAEAVGQMAGEGGFNDEEDSGNEES